MAIVRPCIGTISFWTPRIDLLHVCRVHRAHFVTYCYKRYFKNFEKIFLNHVDSEGVFVYKSLLVATGQSGPGAELFSSQPHGR